MDHINSFNCEHEFIITGTFTCTNGTYSISHGKDIALQCIKCNGKTTQLKSSIPFDTPSSLKRTLSYSDNQIDNYNMCKHCRYNPWPTI